LTVTFDLNNISIQALPVSTFHEKQVDVSVLRLDLIHPVISGNKWFKLRFYLEEARQQGKTTIITRGGAWSNHIPATAAACRLQGLKSIGIIRGEEGIYLSDTLQQAREAGMELYFVSRQEYDDNKLPKTLSIEPSHYFISEGGYGFKGAAGAATILDHCKKQNYSHLCCAVGTGTMMAGLLTGALPSQSVIGVSVLKNQPDIEKKILSIAGENAANMYINNEYHFGGYARYKPELIQFMNEFYKTTGVPTDFVYTGKLFFAIHDLITKEFFIPGSRLLVIHSGGLTGNHSLNKGTLIF